MTVPFVAPRRADTGPRAILEHRLEVVTMTTDRADHAANMSAGHPASVDDLFRGVPVQTAHDLACDGIFETDEELDEFLEFTHAERRANLA
jgi:hypothetical protein